MQNNPPQQLLFSCFGSDGKTGNHALVIDNHRLNAAEKQHFASRQNLAVCVFIDHQHKSQFTLDYYYPHRSSPLCLHGSLAAAGYFFGLYPKLHCGELRTQSNRTLHIARGSGDQITLALQPEDISYQPYAKPEFIDTALTSPEFLQLLGLLDRGLIEDVAIASVGSPKALVRVANPEVLFALQPNLPAIEAWGKRHAINGLYAYTKRGKQIHGRNFNHLDPQLEDSATGVAAGALCSYYAEDLEVHQGLNRNNPCVIHTHFAGQQIILSGKVHLLNQRPAVSLL